MRTIDRRTSMLLVVDFQVRLMPAIEGGAAAVANAKRLVELAGLLDIPVRVTEQNPSGLGPTVAEAGVGEQPLAIKMTFDACRSPGFLGDLPERPDMVVVGCEAHVCVLQTVLGLLDAGRRVYLVRDAVGSRRAESKETAIRRMERHGAEIVTAEMVAFEWIETAEHPRFRDVVTLVR